MSLSFDSFTLAASTADLEAEPAARADADCVEFRMDLADAPLGALASYDGDLPILATNRAAWEGGEASEVNRLGALEAALECDAVAAIDIELAALESGGPGDADRAEALLAAARAVGVPVVVSTHDFEGTPPEPELADRLRRAGERGDVGKIAVTARDVGDALSVLSVTHEVTRAGVDVATMAMGAAGSHTRAVAPVYGSKIGYAPIDPEKATAPGQYGLETLRGLVDRLME
ncbi:3-dehydroquinate dehydratase [Natronomonas moolapensis 8.8.11]|uniref:3-dehydroquinate dehydratase n=1 Tax=Natronomonas moolapensis (strain DSM 18674 / CECT 7526 / JCM 14361 / 8.8.11) TaxID=268739 RepID=M1XNB9_NATM8|nr:type I 3-dehydroquinate dehydratase [Natronomonas moolapensis]CCQ35411.1 3-dehydroquinate dehydratase [Natronomonas moolapensis 8.8.11]